MLNGRGIVALPKHGQLELVHQGDLFKACLVPLYACMYVTSSVPFL